MTDWLHPASGAVLDVAPAVLAWRIGIALVLGVVVAGIYRWARRGESIPPTFLATLVLLATLISMATQIIGDNVARAFSLVGALSVVRFRTVVRDTQDIAFVIFAVVVGMAAGANHVAVGLVGLGILSVASVALWPPKRAGGWQKADSTVSLRLGPKEGLQSSAESLLATSATRCDLIAASTAKQGALLDLTYRVRLRADVSPVQLLAELRQLEGVEGVDLRRSE